jgi:hypothetical protein
MPTSQKRERIKAMKGKGPRSERETIIRFDQDSETASIWTASEVVYRRLMKPLGRQYLTEDGERHAVFTFSKELISLPRAKAKRVLTEAQRAQMASRMSQTRQNIRAKEASRGIPEGLTG